MIGRGTHREEAGGSVAADLLMRFVSYYLRCHPPEGVSAARNGGRGEEKGGKGEGEGRGGGGGN